MPETGSAAPESAQTDGHRTAERIDWEAAEQSPEFRELTAKRRSFVVPATIFFLAWYFGFILLAGYAEDFMGEKVTGDLTVGYTLALTQFVMVWGLGYWYLRKADRVFDPLARRAAERAAEVTQVSGAETAPGRRFERGEVSAEDREGVTRR